MHPRIIFAAGFLVLFVGGGARYAIGLTFKPMVTEFGWERGELGLAVGRHSRTDGWGDVRAPGGRDVPPVHGRAPDVERMHRTFAVALAERDAAQATAA